MKRSITLQYIVLASLLTLALSCHKRGDFEVNCKILKITYDDPQAHSMDYSGIFEYNSSGDPTKLTWDWTSTGRPDFLFKYDNKRRLSEFIGQYEGSAGFDFYTKYFYGPNNVLLYDTTWFSGPDINNPSQADYGYNVNTYKFDSKGRVIEVDARHSYGGHVIYSYSYDANGNKIRSDGFTYDDKKNYLRTNTILMFIMRDYSVNNYKVAQAYNNKGLPLSWETDITFWNSSIDQIEYNCGHNH